MTDETTGTEPEGRGPKTPLDWALLLFVALVFAVAMTGALWAYAHQAG
jgi:hypothetical protein